MLKRLGYSVIEAQGGRGASEIYEENRDKIDIVIFDIILLEINSGEVFDKLKAFNPAVKVLLSSGYEETSLSVSVIKPLAYWSFFKNGAGLKINGVTYLCSCLDSTVRLSKEHKIFFWVDAEDILRFKFYPSYGLHQISQETIGRWQENELFWSLPQIK